MQALKLDATFGLRWIVAGWQMFRRQPFSFIMLWFFFSLLLLCANEVIGFAADGVAAALPVLSADVVATIGSLLFATVVPALTVGFLQACRVATVGLPIHPVLLFAPFRAGRRTVGRLLALGVIQVAAVMTLLFLLGGSDAFRSDPPAAVAPVTQTVEPTRPVKAVPAAATGAQGDASTAVDPAAIRSNDGNDGTHAAAKSGAGTARTADGAPAQTPASDPAGAATLSPEDLQRATLLSELALAYLPVALLMWFAPMLVAWHDVPVGKALFFNLVGVWRNRSAFVVYGVAWVVIGMTMSMLIGIIGVIVGVGGAAMILVTPLAMTLLTCMYCSMYQTYSTVYVDEPQSVAVVP